MVGERRTSAEANAKVSKWRDALGRGVIAGQDAPEDSINPPLVGTQAAQGVLEQHGVHGRQSLSRIHDA